MVQLDRMRIIAGTLKGRRLDAPAWEGLRPTSDKLRETLFNVLAPRIAGRACSTATRARARSASRRSAAAPRTSRSSSAIRAPWRSSRPTSRAAASRDRYAIIRARFAGAERPPAGGAFDVIFLDPPYGAAELASALDAAESLVDDGTRLVIEHAKRRRSARAHGTLIRTRVLTSGDSALAFYRRRRDAPADEE